MKKSEGDRLPRLDITPNKATVSETALSPSRKITPRITFTETFPQTVPKSPRKHPNSSTSKAPHKHPDQSESKILHKPLKPKQVKSIDKPPRKDKPQKEIYDSDSGVESDADENGMKFYAKDNSTNSKAPRQMGVDLSTMKGQLKNTQRYLEEMETQLKKVEKSCE